MPRSTGGLTSVSVSELALNAAARFRSTMPAPTTTRTTAIVHTEAIGAGTANRRVTWCTAQTNGGMARLAVHHWCMKLADGNAPSQRKAVTDAINASRSSGHRRRT